MPDIPVARRDIVMKTVGGVSYADPYAWLHDDSDEAVAYGHAQSAIAESEARASPRYEQVRDEVRHWYDLTMLAEPERSKGELWFWVETASDEQGPVLMARSKEGGEARCIADARSLAHPGAMEHQIRTIEPSPLGTYVAVFFAGPDLAGEWRIVETATGRVLSAMEKTVCLPNWPSWLPDETGLYLATRNDDAGHILRFIPVDEGAAPIADLLLDTSLVPADVPALTVQISPSGGHALLISAPHERTALALVDLAARTARRFLPAAWSAECDGGWISDAVYAARVNADAPRGRVVAIPVSSSQDQASWRTIVSEGEGAMRFAGVVAGRILVCDLADAAVRFRLFAADGSDERRVQLEEIGSSPMGELTRALRSTDDLVINHETFTRSLATYHVDPVTGTVAQLRAPKHDLQDVEVDRRYAVSRDGTRIPYSVVRRSGPRDGPQPTLLYAYGGFNMAVVPTFLSHVVPFVEAGGVYVRATLRGGGEYGREWYEAGRLEHKQNVFDDLFAVVEDLIRSGEASPETLAMNGYSNGGLLAGVAITQRPDLWRVVVPQVPLLDIMEGWPSTPEYAPFWAVAHEDYGDLSNPADARRIADWSPYQNVREGEHYPAVFQVVGEQDFGCLPFHGRKFTAALQHASASGRRVRYRLWKGVGHIPMDRETAAEWYGEWLSFVMDELAMPVRELGAFRGRTVRRNAFADGKR